MKTILSPTYNWEKVKTINKWFTQVEEDLKENNR